MAARKKNTPATATIPDDALSNYTESKDAVTDSKSRTKSELRTQGARSKKKNEDELPLNNPDGAKTNNAAPKAKPKKGSEGALTLNNPDGAKANNAAPKAKPKKGSEGALTLNNPDGAKANDVAPKAEPKKGSKGALPLNNPDGAQIGEDAPVKEADDIVAFTVLSDIDEGVRAEENTHAAEAESNGISTQEACTEATCYAAEAQSRTDEAEIESRGSTDEVTESQIPDDSALQTDKETSDSNSDETENFSDTAPKGAEEEERNESDDIQIEPTPAVEEFSDKLTESDKEDGTESEKKSEVSAIPFPISSERDLHNRTDGSAEQKNEKNKRRVIDSIFDFVELFVFTLVGVLIITSFFVRQFVVDGDSMLNTLTNGDNLLVSDFMYDPQPGDIIVCEDYATPIHKPIVKRVIATEGQIVRFTPTAVYVDGAELDEPYIFTDYPGYHYDVSVAPNVFRINAEKYNTKYVEGQYYEITVPENEIFVMGDHRNNSTDSRVIGTVSEDSVVGKVLFRFYPFDVFGTVD